MQVSSGEQDVANSGPLGQRRKVERLLLSVVMMLALLNLWLFRNHLHVPQFENYSFKHQGQLAKARRKATDSGKTSKSFRVKPVADEDEGMDGTEAMKAIASSEPEWGTSGRDDEDAPAPAPKSKERGHKAKPSPAAAKKKNPPAAKKARPKEKELSIEVFAAKDKGIPTAKPKLEEDEFLANSSDSVAASASATEVAAPAPAPRKKGPGQKKAPADHKERKVNGTRSGGSSRETSAGDGASRPARNQDSSSKGMGSTESKMHTLLKGAAHGRSNAAQDAGKQSFCSSAADHAATGNVCLHDHLLPEVYVLTSDGYVAAYLSNALEKQGMENLAKAQGSVSEAVSAPKTPVEGGVRALRQAWLTTFPTCHESSHPEKGKGQHHHGNSTSRHGKHHGNGTHGKQHRPHGNGTAARHGMRHNNGTVWLSNATGSQAAPAPPEKEVAQTLPRVVDNASASLHPDGEQSMAGIESNTDDGLIAPVRQLQEIAQEQVKSQPLPQKPPRRRRILFDANPTYLGQVPRHHDQMHNLSSNLPLRLKQMYGPCQERPIFLVILEEPLSRLSQSTSNTDGGLGSALQLGMNTSKKSGQGIETGPWLWEVLYERQLLQWFQHFRPEQFVIVLRQQVLRMGFATNLCRMWSKDFAYPMQCEGAFQDTLRGPVNITKVRDSIDAKVVKHWDHWILAENDKLVKLLEEAHAKGATLWGYNKSFESLSRETQAEDDAGVRQWLEAGW